jgi:TetR/AcrR family transcriptional regulator, transcriptional repressor for nem operon
MSSRPSARTALLEAARDVVRAQGFAATSVDQLCSKAGVTKGAFFHHFQSKEALGAAAADYWSETTGALFASAPYHAHADPLDRVLAYIDFRGQLIDGGIEEFTCLVGTMVQETYGSSDKIRAACNASISGHARTLEADIEAAFARYGQPEGVTAQSLALHTQAVLQGGFILAKAQGDPAIARETVAHLKRYVEMMFNRTMGGNS